MLPQLAKLSRALQTESLDLSVVSHLVDATLSSLNDALLPAANWILELKEDIEKIEQEIETEITSTDISTFQHNVCAPFISLLKENISNRFSSSDIVGSFRIFDPRKVPADKTSYGNESVQTLVTQYTSDLPAVSLDGTDFVQERIISTEVSTEWKSYLLLLSKQNGDLKSQLKELTTDETMIALLPNLHKLAAICLINFAS